MPDAGSGRGAVNIVTFTEIGGRTPLDVAPAAPRARMVRDIDHQSPAWRSAMQESFDLLEQVAVALR